MEHEGSFPHPGSAPSLGEYLEPGLPRRLVVGGALKNAALALSPEAFSLPEAALRVYLAGKGAVTKGSFWLNSEFTVANSALA